MGRKGPGPQGEGPVREAPTLLAGLHSLSLSTFLNTDATKQVYASSFSEEGRVAFLQPCPRHFSVISRGWSLPKAGQINQGDLSPGQVAAVPLLTDSVFASFRFLSSVCWGDTEQLPWNSPSLLA